MAGKDDKMTASTGRRSSRRVVDVTPQFASRRRRKIRVERNPMMQRRGAVGGPFGGPPPAPTGAPKEAPPRPRVLSPERQRWEKLTEGVLSVHGVPYDANRRYSHGDIVLHKSFGLGVVEAVDEESGTMRVLFRDGVQELQGQPSAG